MGAIIPPPKLTPGQQVVVRERLAVIQVQVADLTREAEWLTYALDVSVGEEP